VRQEMVTEGKEIKSLGVTDRKKGCKLWQTPLRLREQMTGTATLFGVTSRKGSADKRAADKKPMKWRYDSRLVSVHSTR
jgi:hypothetical protein